MQPIITSGVTTRAAGLLPVPLSDHGGSLVSPSHAVPLYIQHSETQSTKTTSRRSVPPLKAVNDASSNYMAIYHQLREALICFRFGVGVCIAVNDVADHLRVSATPVRETLIRLRQEGFLNATVRRGFVTKIPTVKEMAELHTLVFLLLTYSVKRGRSNARFDRLPSPALTFAATSTAPNIETYVRHFETIQQRIFAPSSTNSLGYILRNANDRTRFLRIIDLESPGHLAKSTQFFEDLSAALRTHELECAIRMLERELAETISSLPALVKEGVGRAHMLAAAELWRQTWPNDQVKKRSKESDVYPTNMSRPS